MGTEALNLPDDLKAALEKAVQRIVEIAQPELVILFGSYAEGRATEESDVDLVVIASASRPHDLAVALRQGVVEAGMALPLDLLVLPRDEWDWLSAIPGHAMRAAARKGVTLYAAA